jgi:hypothetical protein
MREGDIKIPLKEIRWEWVGYFYVAQDRGQWQAFLNTVVNLKRRRI